MCSGTWTTFLPFTVFILVSCVQPNFCGLMQRGLWNSSKINNWFLSRLTIVDYAPVVIHPLTGSIMCVTEYNLTTTFYFKARESICKTKHCLGSVVRKLITVNDTSPTISLAFGRHFSLMERWIFPVQFPAECRYYKQHRILSSTHNSCQYSPWILQRHKLASSLGGSTPGELSRTTSMMWWLEEGIYTLPSPEISHFSCCHHFVTNADQSHLRACWKT